MEGGDRIDFSRRLALYRDIREDSLWLVDLVENLLAVTRAEEGRLDLNIQAEVVSDVMEEAVRHCERHADAHAIRIDSEGELLLASMDGLGLALCKSIVEAHGGRIGVRDACPHGCIFWFTLPALDMASTLGLKR